MSSTDDLAPCQIEDPDLWFSKAERKIAFAKAGCLECNQRLQCLDSTLDYERSHGVKPGIFGGLSADERKALL